MPIKRFIDTLEELKDYIAENGVDEVVIELDSRITNSDFETPLCSINDIQDILLELNWREE